MFDLIMFDLDGTLVDTAGEICDTANAVLRELKLPEVPEALARSWIGHGSRELLVRAGAHVCGLPEPEIRQSPTMDLAMQLFTRFHGERCGRRSTLYPQVRESLQHLAALGIKLAIVSNREARYAEAVMEAHGLRHYFDTAVFGDTLEVKKPDPQTIRYCLNAHGVAPQRALMIGDSAIDVATARNAGVGCWAVPYGYNGGRPVSEAQPDRLIDDISAVVLALTEASHTRRSRLRRSPPHSIRLKENT